MGVKLFVSPENMPAASLPIPQGTANNVTDSNTKNTRHRPSCHLKGLARLYIGPAFITAYEDHKRAWAPDNNRLT